MTDTLHQTPYIGTHLLLIKEGKLLLQKRKGQFTGGFYCPVAGHVDKGEGVVDALIRETKEEADITLNKDKLKIVCMAHLLNAPYKGTRADIINYFILTDTYEGEIKNLEPDKTESLAFYDLNDLPKPLMGFVDKAIKAYKKGEYYIVIDYLTE